MQTYIQGTEQKREKTFTVYSVVHVYTYIYNKISVLSCQFCQLYISKLLCKQLQLKHEGR